MSTTGPFYNMFHIVRLFTRALQMVWDSNPFLTAGLSLLTVLSAVSIPLQVWISKQIIDRIAFLIGQSGKASVENLYLPLLFYIVIWALSQLVRSASFSFRNLLSHQVDHYGQHALLKKAATLDVAFFENQAFYDQMTLSANHIWRLSAIVMQFPEIASQLITMISLLLLLGKTGWVLPLILIACTLPKVAAHTHFTKKKAELYLRHVPAQRMLNYLADLLSERETAKEVRLFRLQETLLGRQAQASQKYLGDLTRITVSQERGNFLLNLLSLMGTAGIWIFTGVKALAGQISPGGVALVFQAVESSRSALNEIAFFGGYFVEHAVFLDTLFGFLDLSPEAVEGTLSRAMLSSLAQGKALRLNGPIEFQHVSFRYPGSQRNVLCDVSFTIQPGEKVALVGENGAGKTTLVKLLARLYDPTEGSITIDGRDLRAFAPQDIYNQIGVIFQDFYRYDLSVRENIGFGNIDALEDVERIRQAAQQGGAAEMVARLPRQYETMLGNRFEGGADLSGGEWQKLALARAFMRNNPGSREAALFILDEPTAALDAYAESEVYRRFSDLTRHKTTLFVTHRLASVKIADRILVLKDGWLIEEGSHEQLLALNGEYAHMFQLQAERYRVDKEPTDPSPL